jgi:hypothetical protein
MSNNKLIGSNKRKQLPEIDTEMKEQIMTTAAYDTRTPEQKTAVKKEAEQKKEKKAKTLTLTFDSLKTLSDLTEITGRSERDILGELAEQALEIMKPKIAIAKDFGMVPLIDLTKKAGQQ